MKLLLVDTAPANCCPPSNTALENEWIDAVVCDDSPRGKLLAMEIAKAHGLRPAKPRWLHGNFDPSFVLRRLGQYSGTVAVVLETQSLCTLAEAASAPARKQFQVCLRKA
ncbi:hypothetical protein HY642_02110 [Candidatus Woesearchaeota archaeon]|nr:hypothetical protein [Candidatus Woesearchaeota archaeon]